MIRCFEMMWYFIGTIVWVVCAFYDAFHGYTTRMWLSIIVSILSLIEFICTISVMLGA